MEIVRRILRGVFSLWLAYTLLFFLLRILPGDAITSQMIDSGAGAETIAARRAALGLDQPLAAQYFDAVFRLARGDFGVSLTNGRAVSETIAQNLPPTVALALGAIGVAIVAGLALGVWSALHTLGSAAISLILSVPILWTGTIAVYVFSAQLNLFPSGGAGRLSQLILPVLVLGINTAGAIGTVFAAGLREARYADYAITARAKGLNHSHVWVRHLAPNTFVTLIHVIALQFGFLLGGVVVTESIFSRPGLGRALLSGVLAGDYPVVQGIALVIAMSYVVINASADLLTAVVDPRVRAQ